MFIVNVEAAIYQGDKWLIGKRSEKEEHAPGEIGLIGGKVEDEGFSSDILERTVKREVREEVDVEVEHLEYVHSASFITDMGENVVNVIFLCAYKSGEPSPMDPDEISGVYWMTAAEVLHMDVAEYVKDYIRLAEKARLRRTDNE